MSKQQWEWEIRPSSGWFDLRLHELWRYKDLLFRLVRRDYLMLYQQTLLGPVWILLQPLITVLVYLLIFSYVMSIPTNGVPPFLFYLSGIILWNVFSDIFIGTASVFTSNAHVFSKVYFPRLIVPLSTTLLHITRIAIQVILLIGVVLYYHFSGRFEADPSKWLFSIFPVLVAAFTGLGAGLIFSVLTARYRDLLNLLHLLIRLLMFVCPIFYSLELIPENIRWVININPLTPMFESFRYCFTGQGLFSTGSLLYSTVVMLALVGTGILLFNKKADSLLDVV